MGSSLPPIAQGKNYLGEEPTTLLPLRNLGVLWPSGAAPAAVARAGATLVLQWVFEDRIRGDLAIVLDQIGAIHPEILEVREREVRLVEPEQNARQILALQHHMIHLQFKTKFSIQFPPISL